MKLLVIDVQKGITIVLKFLSLLRLRKVQIPRSTMIRDSLWISERAGDRNQKATNVK